MKVWVAMDIGCIECGAKSKLIGVYSNQDDAETAAAVAESREPEYETHRYKVYESVIESWDVNEGVEPGIE